MEDSQIYKPHKMNCNVLTNLEYEEMHPLAASSMSEGEGASSKEREELRAAKYAAIKKERRMRCFQKQLDADESEYEMYRDILTKKVFSVLYGGDVCFNKDEEEIYNKKKHLLHKKMRAFLNDDEEEEEF